MYNHGVKCFPTFRLASCVELNVLGGSQFLSLASRAIKAKCDKMTVAYNRFNIVQDSSLDVQCGLCDIQGNTFESLAGKPFLDLP